MLLIWKDKKIQLKHNLIKKYFKNLNNAKGFNQTVELS